MSNSTVYMVVAYVLAAVLYGCYALWLRAQERRLERRSRGTAR